MALMKFITGIFKGKNELHSLNEVHCRDIQG